jgi:hypothetical protein
MRKPLQKPEKTNFFRETSWQVVKKVGDVRGVNAVVMRSPFSG